MTRPAGYARPMDEIRPGLLRWTAFHERIRADVHSALHVPSGTLIDPMEPLGGIEAVERHGRPERIVLTSRHHYRHSDRFRQAFGCPVLCHEAGLHEFSDGREVDGFAFGDELAPGVTALEIGVLTPEETALHVAAGDGALTLADAAIRGRHGELGFVSDWLIGDDPAAVKDGLRAAFRRLCDEWEFGALLLAHGDPIVAGARSALRSFAEAPTAGAPPG
jgi:hypothetical protein